MKLNSKVINVTLSECECSVLKDLLNRCLCFTHDSSSDSDILESVHHIQKFLSDSDKDFVHDFIYKVL